MKELLREKFKSRHLEPFLVYIDQEGVIVESLSDDYTKRLDSIERITCIEELLGFSQEVQEKSFIKSVYQSMMNEKIKDNVAMELLPETLLSKAFTFRISYTRIKDEELNGLAILFTDISELVSYQKTLIKQERKLRLVVSALTNRDDIVELVNEFLDFSLFVNETVIRTDELMNRIHTFKGNFSMYHLIYIVPYLHEIEDDLLEGKALPSQAGMEMRRLIYKDLEVITELSGSSFFENELYLTAHRKNYDNVCENIKRYFFSREAELIISLVEQVFYKSVADILRIYARESIGIAESSGKKISTIVITGDDVYVDPKYYKPLFRSFIHIFNNAIEHGIEEEELREELGKPTYGEIKCHIDDVGNFFELTISDDGRGIDIGKVIKRALHMGIITENEIELLTEEELIEFIFKPNFSTKEIVDTLSGRGVGISVVKAEVEKIGGSIRVQSFMDYGTKFRILVPKTSTKLVKFFSIPILLDLFVESAKIYVKSKNVIDLPISISGTVKRFICHDRTVMLPFVGPESGCFLISCNESLVNGFAKVLVDMDEVDVVYYDEVMAEVLKETCNIIAGNAISLVDVEGKLSDIGTPELVDQNNPIFESRILTWSLSYEDYEITLGVVRRGDYKISSILQ